MERRYGQALNMLSQHDTITVNALSREIEAVFSLLGDGHTYVAGYYRDNRTLKDLYAHDKAGDKLAAVNGVALDVLLASSSGLYSYETESYGEARTRNSLSTLEGLDYLGISAADGVVYTYETADGRYEDYPYYPEDFLSGGAYIEYNQLKETSSQEREPFVSYELQPEHGLAFLKLRSCKYNQAYCDCLRDMFGEIKAQGIMNVCVDLRDNGGGSSMVADEFLRYLNIDEYRQDGSVWRMVFLEFKSEGCAVENNRYDDLSFGGNVYILT